MSCQGGTKPTETCFERLARRTVARIVFLAERQSDAEVFVLFEKADRGPGRSLGCELMRARDDAPAIKRPRKRWSASRKLVI